MMVAVHSSTLDIAQKDGPGAGISHHMARQAQAAAASASPASNLTTISVLLAQAQPLAYQIVTHRGTNPTDETTWIGAVQTIAATDSTGLAAYLVTQGPATNVSVRAVYANGFSAWVDISQAATLEGAGSGLLTFGTLLKGFSSGADAALTESDTVKQSLEKLQAQIVGTQPPPTAPTLAVSTTAPSAAAHRTQVDTYGNAAWLLASWSLPTGTTAALLGYEVVVHTGSSPADSASWLRSARVAADATSAALCLPVSVSTEARVSVRALYRSGVSAWATTDAATVPVGPTSGLSSRTVATVTTPALAVGAAGNVTLPLQKTSKLLSISTNYPAWVRIYGTSTARDNDASRSDSVDPTPGNGCYSDNTLTASTLALAPPQDFCNADSPPADVAYVSVTNRDAEARSITLSVTYLPLEA